MKEMDHIFVNIAQQQPVLRLRESVRDEKGVQGRSLLDAFIPSVSSHLVWAGMHMFV
jgi:hypothetical protein